MVKEQSGTYTLRVMPAHLANQFKDAVLPKVFATPMMVTAMENAALSGVCIAAVETDLFFRVRRDIMPFTIVACRTVCHVQELSQTFDMFL